MKIKPTADWQATGEVAEIAEALRLALRRASSDVRRLRDSYKTKKGYWTTADVDAIQSVSDRVMTVLTSIEDTVRTLSVYVKNSKHDDQVT